jgi:hypothetical protein
MAPARLTVQMLSPYAGPGNASEENRGASRSDRAARRRRDRRTDQRQPGRQLSPSHNSVIDIAIVRDVWGLIVAEDWLRAQAGTGVDALICARRLT